jgi:hypothetical protein
MWVAKIYFLKNMSEKMEYKMAEDIILSIYGLIQDTNPKDCPLYYAPNLLLLVVEIYELSLILEELYSFLNAHTEKLRALLC